MESKNKEYYLSVSKDAQSVRTGASEMNMLARITAYEASRTPEDKVTRSQVLRDIIREAYFARVPRMDKEILKLNYTELKR